MRRKRIVQAMSRQKESSVTCWRTLPTGSDRDDAFAADCVGNRDGPDSCQAAVGDDAEAVHVSGRARLYVDELTVRGRRGIDCAGIGRGVPDEGQMPRAVALVAGQCSTTGV